MLCYCQDAVAVDPGAQSPLGSDHSNSTYPFKPQSASLLSVAPTTKPPSSSLLTVASVVDDIPIQGSSRLHSQLAAEALRCNDDGAVPIIGSSTTSTTTTATTMQRRSSHDEDTLVTSLSACTDDHGGNSSGAAVADAHDKDALAGSQASEGIQNDETTAFINLPHSLLLPIPCSIQEESADSGVRQILLDDVESDRMGSQIDADGADWKPTSSPPYNDDKNAALMGNSYHVNIGHRNDDDGGGNPNEEEVLSEVVAHVHIVDPLQEFLDRHDALRDATSRSQPASQPTSSALHIHAPPHMIKGILKTPETTNSSSASAQRARARREVVFDTICIRRYAMDIGDNPSCSYGCPVSLSWEYEEDNPRDVDLYEMERPPRRRLRHLVMNYYRRQDILRHCGYTDAQIQVAARHVQRVQRERSTTAFFMPLSKVEEVVRGCCSGSKDRRRRARQARNTGEAAQPTSRP